MPIAVSSPRPHHPLGPLHEQASTPAADLSARQRQNSPDSQVRRSSNDHGDVTEMPPLLDRLRSLHQKSSRALILGQRVAAWVHCRDALNLCCDPDFIGRIDSDSVRQMCVRIWTLYICVLSTLAELSSEDGPAAGAGTGSCGGRLVVRPDRDGQRPQLDGFPQTIRQVWDATIETFGGVPGLVNSEVLVPFVLLCIKLRDLAAAREMVEAWLATLPEESLSLLEQNLQNGSPTLPLQSHVFTGSSASVMQASYLRVCELYLLHILPQSNDFGSANDFLKYNELIPSNVRGLFAKRLAALQSASPSPSLSSARRSKLGRKGTVPSSKLRPKKTAVPHVMPSPLSSDSQRPNAANGRSSSKPADAAATPLKGSASMGPSSDPQSQVEEARVPAAPSTTSPSVSSSLVPRPAKSATAAARAVRPQYRTRTSHRTFISVFMRFARRLVSEWGVTLLTATIIFAILRLAFRRLPVPDLLRMLLRRIWQTVRMGTRVTYI
ncbi:hypothetical protein EV182_001095 [Spiromyces aspiralis]|uniref:Uncharacterized protein n=1 Tax=Spiromyces aspiralis TaxID=68401 RepID=A0ACC1HJW4_9FUNG|nr:hypothetical protein EV182_001095 [Spiromyces aspiralis]